MTGTLEFDQPYNQTESKVESNKEDFQQYVRLKLCDCGKAQTSNPV